MSEISMSYVPAFAGTTQDETSGHIVPLSILHPFYLHTQPILRDGAV